MVEIMKKKNNVLALIPTRLNSRRLMAKSLLPINNLPLIIHVYKRTLLSKKIRKLIFVVMIKKIQREVRKYGAKVIMTSKHHRNGTERISEVLKKSEIIKNINL